VPNDDPKATFLGEAQWKWLEAELKKPAEVRLICSSIQVVPEDHGFEKWTNLPREREKLYALLRATKAAGVVLLSGDRHLAELSAMDAGLGYTLFDLTSSGLNQANKRWRALETNRHRVATMDRGDNFGLVRIDWNKDDPQISLEIHDDDGDVIIRQKVPLSRLQPRALAKKGGAAGLAAEAMKHLDKEWKVEMTVQAVGANRGKTIVFLNSARDYRSDRNLTIVLDMEALAGALKEKKIDPQEHYLKKKIRVTGTVELYNDRPQIKVKKLDQIKVVE
jgi:alkaline phosphatase D